MGIALHPYLVGQPYRLRHVRRALAAHRGARADGDVWLTTPGAIASHVMDELAAPTAIAVQPARAPHARDVAPESRNRAIAAADGGRRARDSIARSSIA